MKIPTYLYRCLRCGLTQELVRPIAERDDLPLCPEHPRTLVMKGYIEVDNMDRVTRRME